MYFSIIVMSRYQLGTLVFLDRIFSKARWPRVNGATPGGQPMHFWVPAYATSTCHSSKYNGTPQMDVTVSSISKHPTSWHAAPIPSMGWHAPADVSAWQIHITFGLCSASAALISSSVKTSPYSFLMDTTSFVYLPCMSKARSPKYPLIQIRCLSPCSVKFAMAASQAAEPVPETGIVNSFSVCQTYRKSFFVSSMICRNSGSMWPTCGRLIAAWTRGCAFCGPGPSNNRVGAVAWKCPTSGRGLATFMSRKKAIG
mmetsp:Transcript_13474/g.32544  ORF Transcript_13474/g.32544 Transcript_13474/m.32544 type:complete len:256 (+) Transcript_13474:777-1544(+)